MVTTPAVRQRKKRPDTRRQELLDAATKLLLDRGAAELRVEDVTEAAGAAKGTFYRYFQTKGQLLAALRDRFVEDLLTAAEERVTDVPRGDWEARVEAYVAASVDFYLAHLRVHDVLFHGLPSKPSPRDGYLGGSEVPVIRAIADFVSDGVVEGVFRVRDPWLTASLIYGALHGGLDIELHSRGSVDPERFVASAVEMITKALAPAAPRGTGRQRRRSGSH